MKRLAACLWLRVLAGALCLGVAIGATTAAYGQRFDRPALDAMLAPIALYPDRLLSHVLMAATYPDEVEEAARWLRARPGLSGDAAVRASDGWDWDPSVRSLLAFPIVLDTLADHIRWTADLGQAFLSQREEVMEVIQFLRRRAYDTGNLRSNEAIRVVDTGYAIEIRSAQAETVYVPYYDPRVAYGSWWWPARPPVVWPRWPGYYVPHAAPSPFYWGPGVFVSSGFFFGDFAWARREVRVVDVRPYYYPRRVIVERHVVPGHPAPRIEHRSPAPGVWQHDARRRWSDDARAARRVNEPRRSDRDDRDDRRPERRDPRGDERREGAAPARVVEPPARPPQVARPAPNNPPDARQDGRNGRRVRSDEDRGGAIDPANPPQRAELRDGPPPGRAAEAPRAAPQAARPPNGRPESREPQVDRERRSRDDREPGGASQKAERRDEQGNRDRPRGSRARDHGD